MAGSGATGRSLGMVSIGLRALALLVAAGLCHPAWAAEGATPSAQYEQRVKAVFLFEFTGYLDWPDASSQDEFVIAVLGESSVVEPLREIAGKRRVDERRIVVREIERAAEIDACDVLFIAGSKVVDLGDILSRLAHRPTLTVAEHPGSAERGVAINFVLVDGRVGFEINRFAMSEAGIRPSSELLKLARLVEGGRGETRE